MDVQASDPSGRPARVRSLKVRALQWLAQREHSRVELRGKLLRLAADESDAAEATDRVEQLLDWLEANRYLSEARFAESRVHARAGRFGNLRIRQELAQHKVALSPDAEQALRDSELSRAREVWARRYGAPAQSAAERVRQARFLTGRGFSADVVRQLLRERAAPSEDDPPVDGEG